MQYVIGNWKMHTTVPEAVALAGRIEDGLDDLAKEQPLPTVVLCPPFTALSAVKDVIENRSVQLGAQTSYWADHGPHTGEVSPTQLKELVSYILVGHSERRAEGETDEIVARKLAAVVRTELTPVLCVGEQERTDKAATETDKQLRAALAEVDPGSIPHLLVAYEPVWAVDAEKPAGPDYVTETVVDIRKTLDSLGVSDYSVLYGGDVTADDVSDFLGIGGLDGFLVGHASLSDQHFVSIVSTVARNG